MTVPSWEAATPGSPPLAANVTQLLATHAITYLPTGALKASQSTAGSGGVNSDSLWIAQSFTTAAGQTTTGYVVLTIAVTGKPQPWTISLRANSSGAPAATALLLASLPKEFAASSASLVSVMLPVTGLTASTQYWIVAAAVGDASDFFTWSKSNQTSGASTSTNGTSWTAQAYGLLYQVWDQSVTGPVAGTWEDSGARWTAWSYTSGKLTGIDEYTAGQAANGYAVSARTLSYSGYSLTGVS